MCSGCSWWACDCFVTVSWCLELLRFWLKEKTGAIVSVIKDCFYYIINLFIVAPHAATAYGIQCRVKVARASSYNALEQSEQLNSAGIHVTNIRHRAYLISLSMKYLVSNSNWWTLWVTYLLCQKRIYVSFYQEGIHYCTAHKHSAETVIKMFPDSSTDLINAVSRTVFLKLFSNPPFSLPTRLFAPQAW